MLGRQMLLIGRVSSLIAMPRPPRGALSARVVSTAPASNGRGRCESVCTRGRGGDGRALGRRVEAGVQLHCARAASTRPMALCPHWEGHIIECADPNGGIADEDAPSAEL